MEQMRTNNHTGATPTIHYKSGLSCSFSGKQMFSFLLMVLVFLATATPTLPLSNKGDTFIRNFSDLEYEHQPQNWGMVQAQNGILYFANQGGILEYDGVSWRVYYNDGHEMHSLAIDDTGTIFIGGGNNEIWSLAVDKNGTRKLVSLSKYLASTNQSNELIWSTHTIKNKVYFRTTNHLYIWDHKKMIALKASGTFKVSYLYNQKLLVQDSIKGLLEVVENKLQPFPGGELFTGDRLTLLPFYSDKATDFIPSHPVQALAIPDEMDDQETDSMIETSEISAKPIILVVEDIADMRRYICEPLEADYHVVEAKNGAEGIEKAKTLIPDLIVSDIMMPGKDGYELCATLKKDIKTSHIPIILLTAKASEESVIQGLDTGADDYITKPFNTAILLACIKNLIQLRLHLQLKIQKQMLLQPDEIKVSSIDQEFIKELKEAIKKNLSDSDFGVIELSKLLVMDRTTIYRKIKALTGEAPELFIRSYRLKMAAKLLKGKFGTVSQVSSAVGFDNISYFGKCFKEAYNMQPSSYMAAESGQKET